LTTCLYAVKSNFFDEAMYYLVVDFCLSLVPLMKRAAAFVTILMYLYVFFSSYVI